MILHRIVCCRSVVAALPQSKAATKTRKSGAGGPLRASDEAAAAVGKTDAAAERTSVSSVKKEKSSLADGSKERAVGAKVGGQTKDDSTAVGTNMTAVTKDVTLRKKEADSSPTKDGAWEKMPADTPDGSAVAGTGGSESPRRVSSSRPDRSTRRKGKASPSKRRPAGKSEQEEDSSLVSVTAPGKGRSYGLCPIIWFRSYSTLN